MFSALWVLTAAASTVIVQAASLADVCTSSYVSSTLPSDDFYPGITINLLLIVATMFTDVEFTDADFYPNVVFDYCNITFAYFYGESDDSIPTASSMHWYESIREIIYLTMTYNERTEALSSWYQLYVVLRAAHCATNPLQPNRPFPQTNLAVLVDWIEKSVEPITLNATVL